LDGGAVRIALRDPRLHHDARRWKPPAERLLQREAAVATTDDEARSRTRAPLAIGARLDHPRARFGDHLGAPPTDERRQLPLPCSIGVVGGRPLLALDGRRLLLRPRDPRREQIDRRQLVRDRLLLIRLELRATRLKIARLRIAEARARLGRPPV